MMSRRAVIFIGNSIFGDDGIGLVIGTNLKPRLEKRDFDVHIVERTGFALLDCLEGYDSAVVVDSVCTSGPVGEVVPYSVSGFGSAKTTAPHYSGVPEAVGLMRDLKMRVPEVSVLGINVKDPYLLSDGISNELKYMTDAISDRVYSSILARMGRRV